MFNHVEILFAHEIHNTEKLTVKNKTSPVIFVKYIVNE